MKKIVLIEDDADLYSLIQYNLEKEGFAMAGAQTGKGAIELCRRERPDLIILDIMLPDSDGLEICRAIRNHSELAAVPVIFLTARASETDRIVGLELGANDYIVKPFFIRELIARIKIHFRGQPPATKILRSGDLELDRARCRVHLNGAEVTLTATEFRLLEFLMRRAGRVVSRNTIVQAIWNFDDDVEENTLDAFISLLRSKIDRDQNEKLIQTVRGMGYTIRESSKS